MFRKYVQVKWEVGKEVNFALRCRQHVEDFFNKLGCRPYLVSSFSGGTLVDVSTKQINTHLIIFKKFKQKTVLNQLGLLKKMLAEETTIQII